MEFDPQLQYYVLCPPCAINSLRRRGELYVALFIASLEIASYNLDASSRCGVLKEREREGEGEATDSKRRFSAEKRDFMSLLLSPPCRVPDGTFRLTQSY